MSEEIIQKEIEDGGYNKPHTKGAYIHAEIPDTGNDSSEGAVYLAGNSDLLLRVLGDMINNIKSKLQEKEAKKEDDDGPKITGHKIEIIEE